MHSYVYPAIWFNSFNMKDPVVGGYTPWRVALRRALALAYDRLFEASQKLTDSPERTRIYRRMDRLAFVHMPMVMKLCLLRVALTHPWVKGYRPHSVHLEPWKYLDIDVAEQARAMDLR